MKPAVVRSVLHVLPEKKEAELWANFKKGEESAFTSLYNTFVVELYHYGERLTSDPSLIEDSIHDLFVELWKNRRTISQTDSVKFYLYRGFKNRLIKNMRQRRKFPSVDLSDDHELELTLASDSDFIDNQIFTTQKAELLKAITKLAPRQKEALTLRFYDELSYEEIALLMTLPVKSVYMLIYRSVSFLKRTLKTVLLLAWFLAQRF